MKQGIQDNNSTSALHPVKTGPTLKTVNVRVFYLDFIRAISICLIIIYHFNFHILEWNISDNAIFWMECGYEHTCLGVLGISLFIILSGASLMLSTKERFNAKVFFKKRFLSIYPLFWVTYAAAFLALVLINHSLPASAHPATFLLTIIGLDGFLLYAIPNFYLLGEWFLGFIIIMYVLFPFLRYLFLKYTLLALLLGFLAPLLVTTIIHPEMEIFRFPLFRLTEFVLGMSIIYVFSPPRGPLQLILIAMAGILFYLSIAVNIPAPFNVAMQGISVFIFLAFISKLFDNFLFRRFVMFVSAYSFGAFLVHHVVFIQVLPSLHNRHLSTYGNYLLFFLLLFFIYCLSFLLTNATVFGLRKLAGIKLFQSPVLRK